MKNIEAIVQVEGLDAVLVGPYDLSASMGKTGQVGDAEVRAAIDRVAAACRQRNMPLGYFGVSAQSVRPYIDAGYSLICAGSDTGFVTRGALDMVETLKA